MNNSRFKFRAWDNVNGQWASQEISVSYGVFEPWKDVHILTSLDFSKQSQYDISQ